MFSSVVTRVSRLVSRPALAASLSWAATVGWKLWSTSTASTEEKACTLSEVLHRGRGEGGVRTACWAGHWSPVKVSVAEGVQPGQGPHPHLQVNLVKGPATSKKIFMLFMCHV